MNKQEIKTERPLSYCPECENPIYTDEVHICKKNKK